MITTQKIEGSSMPAATVRAIIDAPPDEVWPILIDCANYKNSMPRIVDSEAVSKTGDARKGVTQCKVTADMPFPISDLVSTTEAIHHVEGTHYERTWSLLKGDYKSVTGSWVLDPIGGVAFVDEALAEGGLERERRIVSFRLTILDRPGMLGARVGSAEPLARSWRRAGGSGRWGTPHGRSPDGRERSGRSVDSGPSASGRPSRARRPATIRSGSSSSSGSRVPGGGTAKGWRTARVAA